MAEIIRTANGKGMKIILDAAAEGMRLEQYLRQELRFTKAQIKSMKFRENGLIVNGIRVRINHVLRTGEILEVLLEDPMKSSAHLKESEEPLQILYEDDDLIAVWKEAGLVLHPSHGHFGDTLTNRVHAYFAGKQIPVIIRSIGRLDRDTSGIVLFAKNQVAAAKLWEQKENGRFWKEYLAVCEGTLHMPDAEGPMKENGLFVAEEQKQWYTISSPIDHLPGDLMRMCVSEQGKPAVTHVQVIETENGTYGSSTLVRVRIETGRTHQIRVHMASIGHPLVGDVLYGSTEGEMYLCAWKTELIQPFTGKIIQLTAENLDSKMKKAVS